MSPEKRKAAAVVAAAFGGKCPSCGGKDFSTSSFKGVSRCCSCGCFVAKSEPVKVGYSDFVPVPFFDPFEVDAFVGAFAECAA